MASSKRSSIAQVLGKKAVRNIGPICVTCNNPAWAKVVDDFIADVNRGRIERDHSTITALFEAMTKDHEELGIPKYTYKRAALRDHLGRCRDGWRKTRG
jgi:hypothetical protein